MQDTLCFQDKLELELALNDYLLDRNPDTDVAESYGTLLEAFRSDIEARCRARNITYTFMTTETPYPEVLGRFLAHRGRG